MPNGNTAIAITGIAAATLFGIVALLVNSETKVNFKGNQNNNSIEIGIEQSQIPQQKQSDRSIKEKDNR